MKCPYCLDNELKVVDSRESTETNAIKRRRECLSCLRRFTTFETIELLVQVHKRDGRYETFSKEKLIAGLEAACHHTTVPHEQVVQLAAQIVNRVMGRQVRSITARELGDMVMKELYALDSIAYIRFACVYRRLKNIDELMEAISSIHPKDETSMEEPSDATQKTGS